MNWQDFRQALRSLRQNPGFALVAIFTLALGIGVNTAIFSVVNGVLLQPLGYRDPDGIVALNTRAKQTGRLTPRLTGGDLLDLEAGADSLEAISSVVGGEMGVQLGRHAEFTGAWFINPAFFRVFRVAPVAGRVLTDSDIDRSGLVSLAFAERNFGSAAGAVGRSFALEKRNYEIAGVLPAEFAYPRKADVWIAQAPRPDNLNRTAYNYAAVARLKQGITLEAAQAQLETLAARMASAFPDSNKNKSFTAVPLKEFLVGRVRSTLYVLMGAVALVLLICCANVANLVLARATARTREMALRAALGAGRWRLARQLLTESSVLGLLGGALGILLAFGGLDALARLAPGNLPRMQDVRLNWVVLAFATIASLGASVLFGMAPAWQAGRADLNEALKQGGARGLAGHGSNRMRHGLVVGEIAIAVVLATGAGLLFRGFLAMTAANLGFRSEGVLVAYAHVPAQGIEEHVRASRLVEGLFPELASLPGVQSVAAAMGIPAGQYGSNGAYAVEGKTSFAPGQNLPQALFGLATPGYFATLGIPLRKGRDFTNVDRYDAAFVAIVSDSLARQSFPNEDPIGKRIMCGLDSDKWMTIVGVVGDVRHQSPASEPAATLYMPLEQHPYFANEVQIVIRTAVEPASLTGAVRKKVQAANPDIATKFTTMDAMVSDSVATPRFRAFLMTSFAALAVLLATAGVYGVMSYVTARRTAELGLRIALGAEAGDVLGLILGRAAVLAGAGLLIGLAISFAVGRALTSMLFGLQPTDPATYIGVTLLVAVVAFLAAAVPALRATRIDPLVALREE